jgi:hypothetical protein
MQQFADTISVLPCATKSVSPRHTILISRPRIDKGEMFVELNIADWSSECGFYFPLESIDSRAVKQHVRWKFISDEKYIIMASAEADITQKDYTKLNLRNWYYL